MPATLALPPIYPITPDFLHGEALIAWAGALFEAGCRFLQYRRKTGPDQERLRDLEELLSLSRTFGCRVIVDDRVDLVMLTGADGVHLGQLDLPPAEARQLLGPGKIIGFSVHSWEQFKEAHDQPVDYLALGPIYPTESKMNPDAVVPETVQKDIMSASSLPLVAIGGITPSSAPALWDRGFASLAVIGALAVNPREAWQEFMTRVPTH